MINKSFHTINKTQLFNMPKHFNINDNEHVAIGNNLHLHHFVNIIILHKNQYTRRK